MECPYCKATAIWRDSSIIYGRNYGQVWICSRYPTCDAYVGCHGDTKTPLGRMANAELRAWKKKAHAVFDPLWKQGDMERGEAYEWLMGELELPRAECHIGMFDVDMCERVIWAVVGRIGRERVQSILRAFAG